MRKLALISMILALGSCRDAGPGAPPPGPAAASGPAAGPSPSTAVLDLDGQPRDPLAPDERADALIFVRSDCPISNRYAPKLGRVAARFADAPVDLWLVYVDRDETAPVIREHMRDYAMPGTPLRDPDQVLVAHAGVEVTPSVAVYDAGGTRRYRGRIDDWYVDYGKSRIAASTDELVDAITAALAMAAPAVAEAEAVGCPIPPLPGGGGPGGGG